MKIAVIGSGDVGKTLAQAFSELGNEVKIGSRNPEKEDLQVWIKTTKGILAASFEEVAKFGEIIVVATPGMAVEEAFNLAGIENFSGKIIIDVTNPIDHSQGMPRLAIQSDHSNGEKVQRLLPKAKVVKTLDIIGHTLMVNPKFEEGDPDMFLCGNDDAAKAVVKQFLNDFGWKNVTDLGTIEQSRIMESLCILWVSYGIKNNSWNNAFKMLRK